MDAITVGVLAAYGGIVLLALLLSVLWVVALVDCLLRRFNDPTLELVWVVVIIFTHALGAILYYIFGRGQAHAR